MAEKREQVARTDVAEAVRAMASFPWMEMLDVQWETAQALREIVRSARERSGMAPKETRRPQPGRPSRRSVPGRRSSRPWRT